MLNPIESYAECGKQCAIARNLGDESRAMFERQYLARMCALETPDNRAIARKAFDDAYKATRLIRA